MTKKIRVHIIPVGGFWKFKSIDDEVEVLSKQCESTDEVLTLALDRGFEVVDDD